MGRGPDVRATAAPFDQRVVQPYLFGIQAGPAQELQKIEVAVGGAEDPVSAAAVHGRARVVTTEASGRSTYW